MKTILPFALLSLFGCTKKDAVVKCYECTMTYAGGLSAATQYPCTDNIAKWRSEQRDNNGQPIGSMCRER